MSYERVMEFIEGHWSKLSDTKNAELRVWLERKRITEDDILAALDDLIEDGLEFTPKTSQIAKKLQAMGAMPPVFLGVGDRGVVGRMKADIIEGIEELRKILPQHDYGDRLREEQRQAEHLAQVDLDNDLGAKDYWHDRLLAFRELIQQEEAS